MKTPTCQRCGERMQEGFNFDTAGGRGLWVAGVAMQRRWWGMKLDRDQKPLPVTTFRCPKCGYLESYAPPGE